MHNDISNDLVSIEYRDNNRIQVIHINSMTREAVNLYINLIQTEIVSRESPLLLSVHNYQNVGGMVSHYYMERIKEFSGDKIRKDSHGRVGVVISNDLFRIMINPIIRIYARHIMKLAIQFFTSVDQAVEWVAEYEE